MPQRPGLLQRLAPQGPDIDRDQPIEQRLDGKHDDVPEVCFYMKGAIDEVVAHHKRLLEEEAKKVAAEKAEKKAS